MLLMCCIIAVVEHGQKLNSPLVVGQVLNVEPRRTVGRLREIHGKVCPNRRICKVWSVLLHGT